MGGLCAGASENALEAVGRFGRHLGLAFKITDDLLDATGSTERLGKQANKDAAAGKQTYPAIHGVQASRERAQREYQAAEEALRMFGPAAERLLSLAEAEPAFTLEEAMAEAQRCARSSPCLCCEVCELLCPDLAITRDPADRRIRIDLDYCKGCGLCAAFCPHGAIRMVVDE